jgi:hypothetical protein
MKFLKGLALSLLSFLLFLSLSVFGVVLMLNLTILNPDFVISELNKLDIPSIAEDLLSQQIPQDEPYVTEVIDNTITDLEPWIREQIHDSIYSSYDYFLGKSQSLNLEISLERPRDSLKDNLREVILRSPPSELTGAPTAIIELYISEAQQYVDEVIPPTFEFNESSLSPEVLSQLMEVKQAIGYVQFTYKVLIALILLLILGIVLLKREVRGATRGLGIIFTTYGVLEYLGIVIVKHLIMAQLPQFSIPPSLQAWLPQLIKDFLVPLEIFSLSLLVAGIALIIVSFVYKSRQPAETEAI